MRAGNQVVIEIISLAVRVLLGVDPLQGLLVSECISWHSHVKIFPEVSGIHILIRCEVQNVTLTIIMTNVVITDSSD